MSVAPSNKVPSCVKSREDMRPDVPRAKEVVVGTGNADLLEMIFGDDA